MVVFFVVFFIGFVSKDFLVFFSLIIKLIMNSWFIDWWFFV